MLALRMTFLQVLQALALDQAPNKPLAVLAQTGRHSLTQKRRERRRARLKLPADTLRCSACCSRCRFCCPCKSERQTFRFKA
jgi:hypothetical protein